MTSMDEDRIDSTQGHQLLRQTSLPASASLPDLRRRAVKLSGSNSTKPSLDLHSTDTFSASPPSSKWISLVRTHIRWWLHQDSS